MRLNGIEPIIPNNGNSFTENRITVMHQSPHTQGSGININVYRINIKIMILVINITILILLILYI